MWLPLLLFVACPGPEATDTGFRYADGIGSVMVERACAPRSEVPPIRLCPECRFRFARAAPVVIEPLKVCLDTHDLHTGPSHLASRPYAVSAQETE